MAYPSIKQENSSITSSCGIEEISRGVGNLVHAELPRLTDMKKLACRGWRRGAGEEISKDNRQCSSKYNPPLP